MKKKLIIGLVAVILLLGFLPLPKIVDRTYYGINTENEQTVTITLHMNDLRFLFLPDKLYGTITVKTSTDTFVFGEHLYDSGQTSFDPEKGRMHNLNGWYYNETMYPKEYAHGTISQSPVGFESLLVHISTDFDKILVLHNTKGVIETQPTGRYIGNTDQTLLEETKEYFSGFYQ
ncbi:MAG: hypothetical protein J6A61_00140 [Clostridia bacterium]|nr:hypothetical protein [Clostridia bacterium]